MDSEIVFLYFDSVAEAERAMSSIQGLEAEGFMKVDEAALVSLNESGAVVAVPIGEPSVVGKSALGGAIGLIAGALIGLPILGAAAGAGIAAGKMEDTDHLDQLISSVGSKLRPGGAALALEVAELGDPEIVIDRLEVHRDHLVRTEVPASLRAVLDEAEGT